VGKPVEVTMFDRKRYGDEGLAFGLHERTLFENHQGFMFHSVVLRGCEFRKRDL
jgi:hypothetical protein